MKRIVTTIKGRWRVLTGPRYHVVDNEFNRANYPSLIGRTFTQPPGYAQVRVQ